MKHVLSLRLRASLCMALAAAFYAAGAGQAFAATTPSAPPSSEINDVDTRSDLTGSVIGTLGTADQCDDPLAPGTCNDHFLTTAHTTPGRIVETRIDWTNVSTDPLLESNLDLFVFKCGATFDPVTGQRICDLLVASSAQDRGTFEYVTYSANPGDVFRIIVMPAFVFLTQPWSGCAAFVDGAVNCPDPAPQQQEEPADTFLQGCAGDTTTASRREIAGGGKLNQDNDEHFQLSIKEDNKKQGGATEGKTEWKDKEIVNMQETERRARIEITCAAFTENAVNDPGDKTTEGSVEARGFGTLKQRVTGSSMTQTPVCARLQAADNGEPGAGRDTYMLTLVQRNTNGTSTLSDDVCTTTPAGGSDPPGTVSEGNINTKFTRT